MGSRIGSLLALAVLALAAVVSATWSGPAWSPYETGPERFGEDVDESLDRPREGGAIEREAPPVEDPRRSIENLPDLNVWPWVVLAVVIGAVIAVLVALRLHFVRRRRQLDRDRDPRLGPVPHPEPEADEEDLAELDQRLDRALDEVAHGEPRNAIVAIWLHLQRLLAARDFASDAADTPSEFAERARTAYHLDPDALGELAALYREARFSRHPLTENHRARAQSCLTRLQAGLREVAP